MDRVDLRPVSCPLCGRPHHRVALRRGERAVCTGCGTTLAHRPRSRETALALTVTALVLAVPAMDLPLVVVRKFGAEHASYLWTGIRTLWKEGMPLLSVWVALCGIIVPLGLLASLSVAVVARRRAADRLTVRFWTRIAHALQHWSMPEVQVLAVLVAFVKIGALVQVDVGMGLWCYAAMSLAILLAWRSAERLEDPT